MGIYIGNFQSLKDYDSSMFDEVWVIVRSLRNGLPKMYKDDGTVDTTVDVYHVPQLSPSPDLFHKYLKWKENGEWNEDTFENKYVPQFLQEMHGDEQKKFLNILYNRGQKKSILLICFCQEEALCHRSIILGLMQGIYAEKGIRVKCEGDDFTNDDYSDYYEQYRKLDNKFIANMQRLEWVRENTFYLLVAGSRSFNDYAMLSQCLDYELSTQVKNGKKIVIVEGDANGADKLAGRYAEEHGYELVKMPADWNKHGKSAGYKRNEAMHLKIASCTGNNHRGCICFWDGQSKGTKHNFMLAEDYKNPIKVCNYVERRYLKKEEIEAVADEVRQESRKYRYI